MTTKFLNGIDLNNQRGQSFADPSSATDAATKQYVDALISGLRWKEPVRAATTANVNLTTDVDAGSVLDGVNLAQNDRILLKNQTDASENGIYVVPATSGTATRSLDADSTAELNAATVKVLEGSVNADKTFTQTADDVVVDTDDQTWVESGGGQTYTADGQGIELSGSQFQLELNGSTLSKSASGLKVNDSYAGNGLTVAGDALSVNTGTASASLLEISSDTVRVAADAAGAGLTGGGGSALAVGAGAGITVNTNDVAIDTSVVARKFNANIGDGSTTAIAVNHQLGTKDVVVQLRQNSDDAHVYADVVSTDTNNVTVTFATAPASNSIRVTVIG